MQELVNWLIREDLGPADEFVIALDGAFRAAGLTAGTKTTECTNADKAQLWAEVRQPTWSGCSWSA